LSEDWDRANRLYLLNRFAEADSLYRRVLEARPNSAAARYNYGNVLFRESRVAPALQQYLGALRRAPRDAAARANAETARRSLGSELPPEEREAIAGPVGPPGSWLSVAEAAWAGLVVLYVVAAIAGVGIVLPRARAVATALAGIIFLAAIVLGLLVAGSRARAPEALVVAPTSQTRAGPGPAEPAVMVLPEGAGLDLGETHGDWTFVSLPNGLSGWAPRQDIGPIP
jgi:tetratricopeptide (TPR) repeat protein